MSLWLYITAADLLLTFYGAKLQEAETNDDDDSISDRQLSCVIYRSSQKRIAREYLIRAQQELADEMHRLKQLTGRI